MKSSFFIFGSSLFLFTACHTPQETTTSANSGNVHQQTLTTQQTFTIGEPTENKKMKPQETEFYKPVPPVVKPGERNANPPSDAIVLFDGENLNQWVSTNDTTRKAEWTVEDGHFTVNPGTGNIQTKERFEDYQLHLEFREPEEPENNTSQDRGNSGVFLASLGENDAGYELQILNSYQSKTYTNGQAGSLYKQFPPLVNASKPGGKWQTYDVVWTAPRFHEDGSLKSPASVTAFQNGILIQNHSILKGVTLYVGHPYYKKHGKSPIKLQDHHHLVSFRNIWVRPLN